MTEGMEGLETDIETAEPKSEELETREGGSWPAWPVGLVSCEATCDPSAATQRCHSARARLWSSGLDGHLRSRNELSGREVWLCLSASASSPSLCSLRMRSSSARCQSSDSVGMTRGACLTGVSSFPCCDATDDLVFDLSDLIELLEDLRERVPALGLRRVDDPDTTDCARDAAGLARGLLFALAVGLMSLRASGKSTCPAADVWLTARLGPACGSNDSVELSRMAERPRWSDC